MKKILTLTIAFLAIALLPQSLMAQNEVKTTEQQEVQKPTKAKRTLKGDVVPLRNPNAKKKEAKVMRDKSGNEMNPATPAKDEKAKNTRKKEIEMIVVPHNKARKDKNDDKKKKQSAAKVINQ